MGNIGYFLQISIYYRVIQNLLLLHILKNDNDKYLKILSEIKKESKDEDKNKEDPKFDLVFDVGPKGMKHKKKIIAYHQNKLNQDGEYIDFLLNEPNLNSIKNNRDKYEEF
jgi:hypothetical protein